MTHIRQRRGTAAEWVAANPVLRLGEVGWETDTRLAKLGNGVTAWNALDYLPSGPVGPPGPPNVLTVNSVTTGAPGTLVSFEINGDSPEQTVDVTIPRGDTGAKGDKGDQGIQGIQGIQGVPGETPSLRGLSVTSQAIGTGSKTFAIAPSMNVAFPVGATVKAQGAAAANYMVGVVTSATTTSVTINVTEVGGSGTFASWTLTLGAYRGADGTGQVNTVNGVSPTGGNVDVKRLRLSANTATSGDGLWQGKYAKLATIRCNGAYNGTTMSFALSPGATAASGMSTALFSIRIRNTNVPLPGTPIAMEVFVQAGAGSSAVMDSVKLINTVNDATGSTYELWIQAPSNYVVYTLTEVSRYGASDVAPTTYETEAPWVSAMTTPLVGPALVQYPADSRYVALTGDQSVAGVKTFSSAITGTGGLNMSHNVGSYASGVNSPSVFTTSGSGNPDGTSDIRTLQFTSTVSGANAIAAATGAAFEIYNATTAGHVGTAAALSLGFRQTNAGTSGQTYGVRVIPIVSGTGGVTSWNGFEARSPTVTGTGVVAQSIGLLVRAQKVTGVTTGWGVYQSGADDSNYFAGKSGFGTVAPTHTITLPSGATGYVHYNTTDQTTNYERVRAYWSSNQFFLTAEAAGTGIARNLVFNSGSSSVAVVASNNIVVRSDSTSAGQVLRVTSTGLTASSGTQTGLLIDPTINQSGTAGYIGFAVDVNETATGSGLKRLLTLNVGGTARFYVSNSGLASINQAANSTALQTTIDGDTSARLTVSTVGLMQWGPGNASADTNLYRSAANTLKTDNSFVAGVNINALDQVQENGQRVYSPNNKPTPVAIGAASNTAGGAEKVAALSATTGTATGDLSAASIFTVTPTGNITLAFSNVPATGTACTVTVIVSQGGSVRTVTPPSGTKWMGAAAPTQVANKACAFTFLTVDGGTTWYASAAVEQ